MFDATLAETFENADGISAAIRRSQEHLRPPPNLKPSEWAETSLWIPEGNAVPGPYRIANAPYQRDPMDQLVNPDCFRVTLKWGAQVGKTLCALAVQGYCVEISPKSQMMMQPSQGDLQTWLETKFNPMVEANKGISKRIAKARGREGVNNQRMKSYPGGFMMFAWAGSPKTMRGRSAPIIVCDEVNGYAVTEEGHPVGLLAQRSATFEDERFLVEISTPTFEGAYIDQAYEDGDQRQFYVKCPCCDHVQTLKWSNVIWNGRQSTDIDDCDADAGRQSEHEPDTAMYACDGCGELWNDGQRVAAIRNAEAAGYGWIAAKPFRGHASYHLNELYSTFRKLRSIVQSYLDKLATDDIQTFVNVSLSLSYAQPGEKLDPTGLLQRARAYAAQVPMGGVYLTCGVDMQPDRLEAEVVAWGVGEESWSVEYVVLWGDPLNQDVWDDLDEFLGRTWQHESGSEMGISATALDTGGGKGGYTQRAYEYARGKQTRRLFAIKGGGTWGSPIVAAPSRKKTGKNVRKVDLFIVGANEAKKIVMDRLALQREGPGYCHFPEGRDADYYKQLTAEKLTKRYVKGFPIREWVKGDKDRNEALDCRVYAFAALKITNPNLARLAKRMGVDVPRLRESIKAATHVQAEPVQQIEQTPGQPVAAATPQWAQAVASTAVRLMQVTEAVREASAKGKPQEEQKAPQTETKRIRRSHALRKGGGYVRNF
jgi:phage terminase large subunit GpA-like protein